MEDSAKMIDAEAKKSRENSKIVFVLCMLLFYYKKSHAAFDKITGGIVNVTSLTLGACVEDGGSLRKPVRLGAKKNRRKERIHKNTMEIKSSSYITTPRPNTWKSMSQHSVSSVSSLGRQFGLDRRFASVPSQCPLVANIALSALNIFFCTPPHPWPWVEQW